MIHLCMHSCVFACFACLFVCMYAGLCEYEEWGRSGGMNRWHHTTCGSTSDSAKL